MSYIQKNQNKKQNNQKNNRRNTIIKPLSERSDNITHKVRNNLRSFKQQKQHQRIPYVVKYANFKETRLLDQNGVYHKNVYISDAKNMAREVELDLVCFSEDNSNGNMPLCKIIDFGKWQYEEHKKQKKIKNDNKKISKEIRFNSPLISDNDVNHKINTAKDFLLHGYEVTLSIKKNKKNSLYWKEAEPKMNTFANMCNEGGTHTISKKTAPYYISIKITPKKGDKNE